MFMSSIATKKDKDFFNTISLVSTTKSFIQKLWDDGWEPLLQSVKVFCV